MRKEAKQSKSVTITTVHGYHEGGSWSNSESYAFAGFTTNKYFTSDRFIKLDDNFRRADGKPLKGYGLEIETECNSISSPDVYAEVINKIILAQFPADLCKLQRDGSLSGQSSAEIITQVMTREFIRNNYSAFKLMYDTYFKAFNISCAASGRCGMHVNLSNGLFGNTEATQATAIKKLLFFINKHYQLACYLFNRNPARTMYCQRMAQYTTAANCKAADLRRFPNDHGLCFNGSHYAAGRVELRLVGGQRSYGAFRNTMESVFHLVDACKRCTWAEMEDITKVFSGCNQYVWDRLTTNCYQAGAITDAQIDAIRPTVNREEVLL